MNLVANTSRSRRYRSRTSDLALALDWSDATTLRIAFNTPLALPVSLEHIPALLPLLLVVALAHLGLPPSLAHIVKQCCKRWLRSMVWTANGERPPYAPGGGACDAISETSSAQGTTRFIAPKNAR